MIDTVVRRVSSAIFIGRVAERAQLQAAIDASLCGEPGLMLIGGEAGIGKSRLVGEAAGAAEQQGMLVVQGRCLEASVEALPFTPFVEILRQLLLGEVPRGGSGPVEIGDLGRIVPEIRRASAGNRKAEADDRVSLFHQVHDLLRQVAEETPLLLVFEDLHWADVSSLDLLRFLGARLGAERLLMIGTFRTDEPPSGDSLIGALAELARQPHVVRMELPPFTDREVAEQLTGITGRRPDAARARAIAGQSGGNPFFVEELAGQQTGRVLAASLQDVLADRLAKLAPESRRVVTAAAAIGHDVTQDGLVAVLGLSAAVVADAIREALERNVLLRAHADGGSFTFRHALIAEFAYGALLPAERRELHAEILRSLQAAGGSAAEIARHALLAGERTLALEASIQAAVQARQALAFAEALAHVHTALRLWIELDSDAVVEGWERRSLLLFGARCAFAAGDWHQAVTLARWARSLTPSERVTERVDLLLDLAVWHKYTDDEVGFSEAIAEVAALVPESPPSPQRARILAELAVQSMHEGRLDVAQRQAEEGMAMARACAAPAQEVRALTILGLTSASRFNFDEADRAWSEAASIVEREGVTDEYVVASLIFRTVELAFMAGQIERSLELADAGMARAARAGTIDLQRPFLRWGKVAALGALGRWAEAEELVREAEHDSTLMQTRQLAAIFVDVLVRQGRVEQAERGVSRTDFGYEDAFAGSWALQTRIKLAYAAGRLADARSVADEAVALYEGLADEDLLELLGDAVRGEADWAEAAQTRRRAREAAEARRIGLERLEHLRRLTDAPIERGGAGPIVEAARATAEAEGSRLRGEPDPSLWADVVQRRDTLRQPWEAAYARFRQAEAMLAGHGDRRAARELVEEAHTIASHLGARPLLEQVERLARRARLRLSSAEAPARAGQAITADGVAVSLTAREQEVLSLVAAGHTNREIGQQLFISEKTASVHITNAMDKLGALSRYEAAASATRLGLIKAIS
ncbi:MAG TPA: AAA family ATPase [Candidatus Limnocylindria bacterium]